MNGVFNDLLTVDMVTDGVAVGPVLYGRKVLVSFLWVVTVCFVGGFTSQASSQPVSDLAAALNEQLSENHPANQFINEDGYIAKSNDVDNDYTLPSPVASCFARYSLDRIKEKFGFC